MTDVKRQVDLVMFLIGRNYSFSEASFIADNINDEDIEKFKQLVDLLTSVSEQTKSLLNRNFKPEKKTARKNLTKTGRKKHVRVTPAMEQKIVMQLKVGSMSKQQIASQHNVSSLTIYRIAKKHGLESFKHDYNSKRKKTA